MSLFAELKRRNVVRVGLAYVLIAWVLLQAADFGLDLIDAPNWVIQALFLLAALGLPLVLVFSWVYEMTPEGLRLEKDVDRSQSITPSTGHKLDRIIIAFLAITVVFLIAGQYYGLEPGSDTPAETVVAEKPTPAEQHFPPTSMPQKSVAVLPFLALSSGDDDEFFADGLTEEILNALAQLQELQVTARTSSFHFKGQNLPAEEIAASLGVDHIVEGSVRRSGERLRVTAQLIRAADGFHLWSENYDRTMEDAIAVQEDIAVKIASALNVVLDDSRRELIRRSGIQDVEAFIEYQKARELYSSAHGSDDLLGDLREANRHLERAIERAPEFSLAYLFHSDYYTHILLENATGLLPPGITEQDVSEALDKARADFSNAARFASNSNLRLAVELDLALLSDDWRDLDKRYERFMAATNCSAPLWVAPLGTAFRDSRQFMVKLRQILACDPLGSTNLVNFAGASVWTGDPELALNTTREAMQDATHDWIAQWNVRALVMSGKLDEAASALNLNIRSKFDKEIEQVMLAAANGRAEDSRRLAADWQRTHGPREYEGALFAAWTGDREGANGHAASIDATPLGHLSLYVITYWCICGAPFDLEATPNFAARIQESGLAWPPPNIVKFPLKDW